MTRSFLAASLASVLCAAFFGCSGNVIIGTVASSGVGAGVSGSVASGGPGAGGNAPMASGGPGGGVTGAGTGGAPPGSAPCGTPIEIVSGLKLPLGLASQDGTVFWMDETGAVASKALAGGTPKVLTSTASGGMALLTVGGDYLYWTDSGKLYRMPIGGGAPTVVTTVNESFNHIVDLAADAESVYWTNGDEIVKKVRHRRSREGARFGALDPEPRGRRRVRSTGPTARTPSTRLCGRCRRAAGPRSRSLPFKPAQAGLPSARTAFYYLVEEDSGASNCSEVDVCHSVRRVPKAGGAVTVIASHQKTVGGVVVDDSHVYWLNQEVPADPTNQPPATVMRAPIDGGPAEALATFTPPQIGAQDILSTPPPVLCPGGICWAGGGGSPPGGIWRFVACD